MNYFIKYLLIPFIYTVATTSIIYLEFLIQNFQQVDYVIIIDILRYFLRYPFVTSLKNLKKSKFKFHTIYEYNPKGISTYRSRGSYKEAKGGNILRDEGYLFEFFKHSSEELEKPSYQMPIGNAQFNIITTYGLKRGKVHNFGYGAGYFEPEQKCYATNEYWLAKSSHTSGKKTKNHSSTSIDPTTPQPLLKLRNGGVAGFSFATRCNHVKLL